MYRQIYKDQDLMNELVMTVFIEEPLALHGTVNEVSSLILGMKVCLGVPDTTYHSQFGQFKRPT